MKSTMKLADYRTELESWESQRTAGRYNPATVLKVDGHAAEYTLGAGRSDSLTVFVQGNEILVLSVNHGLGYVGLEIFDSADGSQIGERFYQDEDELKQSVGPKGLDYSERTLATRLANEIYN